MTQQAAAAIWKGGMAAPAVSVSTELDLLTVLSAYCSLTFIAKAINFIDFIEHLGVFFFYIVCVCKS